MKKSYHPGSSVYLLHTLEQGGGALVDRQLNREVGHIDRQLNREAGLFIDS